MNNSARSPKRISLNSLSPNGENFRYDSEEGSLNQVLRDLIGTHKYHAEVYIEPLGEAYAIRGHITTNLDLLCSKCAFPLEKQITAHFDELIVIQPQAHRNEKEARVNHTTDLNDGPFCNLISTPHFEIGEFLHEQIAINTPATPLGRPDCDSNCENYQNAEKEGWLNSDETEAFAEKSNPFSVLGRWKT